MNFASVPEAAEVYKIHPATVRARIKNGKWPAYNFGGKTWRIDLDEINALVRRPRGVSVGSESGSEL